MRTGIKASTVALNSVEWAPNASRSAVEDMSIDRYSQAKWRDWSLFLRFWHKNIIFLLVKIGYLPLSRQKGGVFKVD